MSRQIRLLDRVLDDLQAGLLFYESRQAGLGIYFMDSLLADLQSLHLYAGIHSRHFGFCRMLAKRFPFAIYYELNGDLVQVVAILDMRQEPGKLVERLQGDA